MKPIRNSIIGYHLFSLIIGVVYYYGSVYGFYFVGSTAAPLFEYIPPPAVNTFVIFSTNFVITLLGSLVPALLLLLVSHYLLMPNTPLFLITSSIGFIIFSAWYLLDNVNGREYLYPYLTNILVAKALGGFCILWGVGLIYLKLKPNQRLHQSAAKNAAPGEA